MMEVLNCLAGQDVNRYPGEIYVEVINGRLFSTTGHELLNDGQTKLLGWGSLDGEAIELIPAEGGNGVTVPISEFERIAFDTNKLNKTESESK